MIGGRDATEDTPDEFEDKDGERSRGSVEYIAGIGCELQTKCTALAPVPGAEAHDAASNTARDPQLAQQAAPRAVAGPTTWTRLSTSCGVA